MTTEEWNALLSVSRNDVNRRVLSIYEKKVHPRFTRIQIVWGIGYLRGVLRGVWMKRNAFYRRSRNYDGRIAGLNERLVWHLSKHGNSTGSDIAATLNIPLAIFNKYVGAYIKRKTVVHIERHSHYITPDGLNDYTYELIHFGNGSFVSNKPGIKKNIVINPAKGKRPCSDARETAIKKAKIRAWLIASGHYCNEMG